MLLNRKVIYRIWIKFLIFCFVTVNYVTSWDFAVTTKNKILFYNSTWHLVTSAAHQFNDISAFAFDEIEDVIYFNDLNNGDGSIFKLKLQLEDDINHRIEKLVHKQRNESIQGIAFDPLEKKLYWTDMMNKKIYSFKVGDSIDESIQFLNVPLYSPHGLAIDICRRNLYWTNQEYDNPSVEGITIDKKEQFVLAKDELYRPYGISVDQYTERVYWVNDIRGSPFKIEHSKFNGDDRRTLFKGSNNDPHHLAVDGNYVYWTDKTNNAIWKLSKTFNFTDDEHEIKPMKVMNYDTPPKSILIRSNFVSMLEQQPECKTVIKKIKNDIRNQESEKDRNKYSLIKKEIIEISCFNNAILNKNTKQCICTSEYFGKYCELPKCHNYCINGICTISISGYPQCRCPEGYGGERCEKDLCSGFCLNGGHCEILNGSPTCHCSSLSYGKHCEIMESDQNCEEYCYQNEPLFLTDYCERCRDNRTADLVRNNVALSDTESNNSKNISNIQNEVISQQCQIPEIKWFNSDIIGIAIITSGVVTSLIILLCIVKTIRKYYKPRPKIKKKFVVRKTPNTAMTCRPGTTEQCEITIEDCCNMNICETPCFDPKTLQESTKKEDKIKLLQNDSDIF